LYSLLADTEPTGGGHPLSHNANFYTSDAPAGAFYPGDEYANDTNKFYFAVNAMANNLHEATVTYAFGSGPIADNLTLIGPTVASNGGTLAASALLMTNAPTTGNNAAVPGHVVTFTLGSKTCSAVTDLDGVANCSVEVAGPPLGTLKLTASAAATRAYVAASATRTITLTLPVTKPMPVPKHPQIKVRRRPPPLLPHGGGA
jgi:hypothetical protein